MPRLVLIKQKTLILTDEIAQVQRVFNDAFCESGLKGKMVTEADSEEYVGGGEQERAGLLNKIRILYEKTTDGRISGHEKVLPQYKYYLDGPAYKLQDAYVNYLNFVFNDKVNAKEAEKKNRESEGIIDNHHVYVREILLRLFTAAISIEKNNSTSSKEAKKITECLRLFVQKINNTTVLYNKKILSLSSDISSINIAFASEHKEWIYLLQQMQEIIGTLHKHTASISKLIEVLQKVKSTAALQLVAYISAEDRPQEDLLPGWIKYTLFSCEAVCLKETTKPAELYRIAAENYDSTKVTPHQQRVIEAYKNQFTEKIKSLYDLLSKTNLLLAALDQIDILLSTTGWVLIISNVLNLNGLADLIENYCDTALLVLKFDINSNNLENKSEIKKSLIANGALSGIDFQQNLTVTTKDIKQIQSGIIKNCIIGIIKTAVSNLQSLQEDLNCSLIDITRLATFTTTKDSSSFMDKGKEKVVERNRSDSDSSTGFYLPSSDTQEVTLARFNELVSKYREASSYNPGKDTETLIKECQQAKSDEKRAALVSDYLKNRKEGTFYGILIEALKAGTLYKRNSSAPTVIPSVFRALQELTNESEKVIKEAEICIEENKKLYSQQNINSQENQNFSLSS